MSNYHDSHAELEWQLDPSYPLKGFGMPSAQRSVSQVYRYVPAGSIVISQPEGLPLFWYSEADKQWKWAVYGGAGVGEPVPYSVKSVDEIKAWVIAAWRTQ